MTTTRRPYQDESCRLCSTVRDYIVAPVMMLVVAVAVVLWTVVHVVHVASAQPGEYTHAFVLDFMMFDGLRITTDSKSARTCELARAMVNKKLLQEAEGIVRYDLGLCAPK